MPRNGRRSRRGFTLAELLVIIFIIVILIGFFLPPVRKVREAAKRAQCLSNIRQVMLALQNYESEGLAPRVPLKRKFGESTEKYLPTGCWGPGDVTEDRLSWMVAILPFIEGGNIYQQIDIEKRYSENGPAAQKRLLAYQCPAAPESTTDSPVTHYIAMAGVGRDAASQPAGAVGIGFMGYDRLTSFADIKDGQGFTIALIDTRINLGPWARSGPSNVRGFVSTELPLIGEKHQFGGHAGGALVALADCSTRSIAPTINPKVLAAAITIAGNDTDQLGSDW